MAVPCVWPKQCSDLGIVQLGESSRHTSDRSGTWVKSVSIWHNLCLVVGMETGRRAGDGSTR